MRRTKFDIVMDIIKVVVANRDCNKTKIVYGANLNFKVAGKYISYMLELGFLEIDVQNGKTMYVATEKGRNVLTRFSEIEKDMEFLKL